MINTLKPTNNIYNYYGVSLRAVLSAVSFAGVFFGGKEEALGSRKRMLLPSLTRIRACRSQGFHPENRKAHPISYFFQIRIGSFQNRHKTENPVRFGQGFSKERRRHTLPHNCSTICAGGLNFSVRDGKR